MRRRRAVGVRRVAMGRDQYGASEDGLEVSFEQYGVPLTNTTRQRMRWRVTAGRWLYMRSFALQKLHMAFICELHVVYLVTKRSSSISLGKTRNHRARAWAG